MNRDRSFDLTLRDSTGALGVESSTLTVDHANILIIDDESDIVTFCQRALKRDGYDRVTGVSGGREGLDLLREGGFDLLITDLNLPKIGGLDLLVALREFDPDISVIVITSYGTLETVVRALKLGVRDFLLKPFDHQELVFAVRRVLAQARLFEENQRLKVRLPMLEISKVLMSEVHSKQLTHLAIEIVRQELNADYVSLMLLDQKEQVLEVFAALGLDQKAVASMRANIGEGLCGTAAQTREPILVSEFQQRGSDVSDPSLPDDTGSAICVPLMVQNRLLGVLNVSRKIGRVAFWQDDLDLLLILGGQIAVAIENARVMGTLERRVADRTRELTALYEVTAVASQVLDLNTMLAQSLDRVLIALQSDVGAIQLLDETTGQLRLVAQQGMPQAIVAVLNEHPLEDNIWSGRIIREGEPFAVSDVARVLEDKLDGVDLPAHAFVGAPIQIGRQVLGVLSVFGRTSQQFNVEDVALLASIADQIAVAVENARLRQQAERSAVVEERARLARELHDSVTQSLYSLTLFAEAGQDLAHAGNLGATQQQLTRIGEVAQQALKEMRLLVYELRPMILQEEGLIGALRRRLEAVEGRVGVQARLLADEALDLPACVEEELYRIVQEALNNVLKHAEANSVTVHIQRPVKDRVELRVIDDGVGFEPELAQMGGGIGLASMRERAERLGGTLTVWSSPGNGTTIRVVMEVKQ
ncbi:MAG: GAF domain-containing protein [Anaerolineae bacterium]|nr:GAF domain-containing protein [Anaerolineae bacterium]